MGDADVISDTGLFTFNNASFSMLFDYEENSKYKTLKPPTVGLGRNGYMGKNNGFYSAGKASSVYKYELEFQELQLILLWFFI